MRRQDLLDSLIDRTRGRNRPKREVVVQRLHIDRSLNRGVAEKGLQLRAEEQPLLIMKVVEGLLLPGRAEEEAPMTPIPQGKREHTPQASHSEMHLSLILT